MCFFNFAQMNIKYLCLCYMIWYDLEKTWTDITGFLLTHKSAIRIVWKSLNILPRLGWAANEKPWKLRNSVNHKYFIKGLKSLDLDKDQGRGRVMNRSEDAECCISLRWKTSCIALFSFLGSVIMRFVCFLRSNEHAKQTSQNRGLTAIKRYRWFTVRTDVSLTANTHLQNSELK